MHVLIPQLLARIGEGNSSFRLQVSVGSSSEMRAELEAARLDFVIARRASQGGMEAEHLYTENTVVACGRHNKTVRARPPLADLVTMPWVLPKPGFYSRDALDAFVSAAGLASIVPVIECDSFELNLSVVASTRFIALAPEFAARRFERLASFA
jgi:DNA-binding transcriptional LysR family regulator